MDSLDQTMMTRALELAENGRGLVEPNPLVGAVVAREGRIVGEGWHERFGEAHAEVNALARAGEAARGASLFVTLEPCCHQGKTPPCTAAIVRAGVRRVVAALADPFPDVAGRGIEALRSEGVDVEVGVGEAAARAQNAPYLKLLRTGKPWVIAKWAMSLDGKIATRTGESRWLTGPEARARVHQLRGRMDAILVGIGTVLADDPLLTARPPGPRTATRVVLDSRLRLPLESQLVRTARQTPLIAVHDPQADAGVRAALTQAGCECLTVRPDAGSPTIDGILLELGRRRFTNLLVEGGAKVLGSLFDAQAIDEVYAFVAPTLVGGGPGPLAGHGLDRLADALLLSSPRVEAMGRDVLISGRTKRDSATCGSARAEF